MARYCARCRLALRANDPSYFVQVLPTDTHFVIECGAPVGGIWICNDCWKVMCPEQWTPLAVPRPSLHDPTISRLYCSLCERYAREDEDPGGGGMLPIIRLAEEDVAGTDVMPGARPSCRECFEKWRQIVYQRYLRDGILPPGTPITALSSFNLV